MALKDPEKFVVKPQREGGGERGEGVVPIATGKTM